MDAGGRATQEAKAEGWGEGENKGLTLLLNPLSKGNRGGFNGADDSPNRCHRLQRRGIHPSNPPFTKRGFYLPPFSEVAVKLPLP